jgi:predicted permease
MTNFIIIFLCLFLGAALKYVQRFPRSSALTINLFIIYISLPALILNKFPPLLKSLKLTGLWWVPISMAWITFILSWFFISTIGRKLNWSRAKTGALILTAGLGNTSFVGFPLLEAILGKNAIPIGILADQPGSFLIVSSLGIFIAAKYSGEVTNYKFILKKVFTFPPFLALLISIIWTFFGNPGSEIVNEAFEKISLTLVPLALFSVGFQTDFNLSVIKRRMHPLLIGICFKLFFLPIFFYLLFNKLCGFSGDYLQVTILESAMATQITSAVVANEFNLDAELANLMVGITIPLSLITVWTFNWLLFH